MRNGIHSKGSSFPRSHPAILVTSLLWPIWWGQEDAPLGNNSYALYIDLSE